MSCVTDNYEHHHNPITEQLYYCLKHYCESKVCVPVQLRIRSIHESGQLVHKPTSHFMKQLACKRYNWLFHESTSHFMNLIS
jgi:hypothetical protein